MSGRLVVITLLLMISCDGAGDGSTDELALRGTYTRDSGGPCRGFEAVSDSEADPVDPTDKQLTIRDGEGSVTGTTTLEQATYSKRTGGGCQLQVDYSVDIKKADFYVAQLEGAIDEPETEPISYEDLSRNGFECDLLIDFEGDGLITPSTSKLEFDC